MKKLITSILAFIFVFSLVGCANSKNETVIFNDQAFNKADLSRETLEWLEWYGGLTEAEKLEVDYIPSDLGGTTQIGCEEAVSTQNTTTVSITYEQITAAEAKALMGSETNYIVLDVRTEGEFNESHIQGAILIPDYDILEKAEGVLTDKDQLILVYCRSGRRSKLASENLVNLGYTNIKEFGGIIDWPYGTVTE